MTILRRIGAVLFWLVVAFCIVATVTPYFLDRIYYRGAESGHFDGDHFFNPDGEDTFAPPSGGRRAGFITRWLIGDDRPAWPEQVAVTPAIPPQRVTGGDMRVTWVGHATLLVQANGLNILTDPIWSDVAGPFGIGPARVAAPGIRFEDLPRIDVVLVSHNHYDHLDLATLKRLWQRDRPTIVTGLGNDAILRSAGIGHAGPRARVIGLDWGQRHSLPNGAEVVVTRNHHWSSRWFADRNRALWSSFVVRLPQGNFFFAGDTGAGDYRWADAAAAYGPIRLAAIPIGAFRFVEGQMGTGSHIGPVDAVEIFRRLGASRAVAIHWGTFRLSREAWATPPRLLSAARTCVGMDRRFGALPIGRGVAVAPYDAPPARPAIDREALLRCLDTQQVRALR